MDDNTAIKQEIKDFFDNFSKGDLSAIRDQVSDDVKSYITQKSGEVDLLAGADPLLDNLAAMDVKAANLVIRITQIAVINSAQALVMVEIKAERKAKKLHNFAAFLLSFDADKISEIRMVEALPAYSEEFWKR